MRLCDDSNDSSSILPSTHVPVIQSIYIFNFLSISSCIPTTGPLSSPV